MFKKKITMTCDIQHTEMNINQQLHTYISLGFG